SGPMAIPGAPEGAWSAPPSQGSLAPAGWPLSEPLSRHPISGIQPVGVEGGDTLPEGAEPLEQGEGATAADRLVAALLGAGLDTSFGVPGGPIMPLFDALLRSRHATLVESRHETNAAFSAMGYWRATGKVPAVVVTAGPGATNVVTGVVAAHCERVPMIVLC